jgi:hypothetical protein
VIYGNSSNLATKYQVASVKVLCTRSTRGATKPAEVTELDQHIARLRARLNARRAELLSAQTEAKEQAKLLRAP